MRSESIILAIIYKNAKKSSNMVRTRFLLVAAKRKANLKMFENKEQITQKIQIFAEDLAG